MFHTSYLELSEDALRRNIRFLKQQIGPDVKLSSVVKGNAYGHGFDEFVPLAERCGVNHFSVFNTHEAWRVVRARTKASHVMVMGHCENEGLEWAVENDVSFYVFDRGRMEDALEVAKKVKKPARIHLELETGMHRSGLEGEELDKAVEMIRDNRRRFVVEGTCTHFAGAESVNNYLRIRQQIERYEEMLKYLRSKRLRPGLRHAGSSAATFVYPETRYDMVRVGIAGYGFWPSKETQMHYYLHHGAEKKRTTADPLRRVMSWKSHVMTTKIVEPGEFIGYGTSSMATRRTRIAVVPVGYDDGFPRSLSNLGYVLIRGRRAPVKGIVNMNMVSVDITENRGVERGDEVVIIGKQKKQQISVSSFGELTRFLNYEVLVRLPMDIPRRIVA